TLKAVILEGSLGQSAGETASTWTDEPNKDLHLLQIGANIIDQYDSDSIPTSIRMGGWSDTPAVYGIENLPYMNKVRYMGESVVPNRQVGAVNNNAGPDFHFRLSAELWNPHLETMP